MRAARVQTALADAWEVHGRLRAGVARLRGIRVMASGLAHPQYNSGDVSAPDADVDGRPRVLRPARRRSGACASPPGCRGAPGAIS